MKDAVCKSFSAALWWSAEATLAAMHTFRTVAEAVATGYVLATHRVYRSYKECLIFGQDTGQMRLGGRGYGLRVEVPDVFTQNYLGVSSFSVQ